MSNTRLLVSSIVLGHINIYLCLFYLSNSFMTWTVVWGVFFSILNHGLTNDIVKWTDRLYMITVAYYNIYHIECLVFNVFIGVSCILFFVSKTIRDDRCYIHLFSHFVLVFSYYLYFKTCL